MAPKCLLGIRQRDVGVNLAVDYVAVHGDQVRGRGRVLHEHILGGERPIAHLVHLVTADGAGGRQDHRVPNLLLLHHLFDARQQVHIELEAQDHHPLEVPGNRVDIRHLVAVGLGVTLRRGRPVHDFSARLLGAHHARYRQYQYPVLHALSIILRFVTQGQCAAQGPEQAPPHGATLGAWPGMKSNLGVERQAHAQPASHS